MADVLYQPGADGGGVVYRSRSVQVATDSAILAQYPGAGLYAPGAYATVGDLFSISVPQDSSFDFSGSSLNRFLTIAAGRINEHLGNRGWHVPLVWWSETVVWVNTELAYIMAARQRGINTEGDMANFAAREKTVLDWLKSARDGEITPDQRESTANLGSQAFRYVGERLRGWGGLPRR